MLLAIGDPLAYDSPFWKNSPYFALYNVQPYLHTIFGDTSNAGRFNLDPNVADYLEHLARVFQERILPRLRRTCATTSVCARGQGSGRAGSHLSDGL